MQKGIKQLLKDSSIVFAIIITLVIVYLSLIKIPKQNVINFNNLDKVQHSIAYFFLSVAWLFTFYKKPSKKTIVVILCIVFGIVIEVLQEILTAYRTGDLLDIIANSFGILLGLVFFNRTLGKKHFN
ncbi:VanZ family protein [uncultured Polaribacter sp.]|uniref:VanZ family protein n=1 Tax=uncultured Polaribacter sp. TaxID=174711 RepID=UPI002630A3A1|nr:VanZ family protein [uncultured Polaribacter sp.]